MKNESEKLNLNDEEMNMLEAELLPTQALRETLEMSERGNPKQTINNAVIVFKDDPMFKNHLRINLFRDQIEFTGDAHWKRKGIDVSEMDEIHIRHYLETEYQLVNEKKIKEALMIAGSESAYHPVREYLESLSWDGKERIRYALHHFLGAEVNEYVYEVMKVFLLGAISRVYYPGIKFEYMLCLVGGQGAGKSTFIRFLASRDSWFCDDIKRLDDEKVYEHLAGHWIIEIAEMLALNNAKCNEATKAFLSRQYDNYRTPFMTRAEDRPRQCVFAGTSNMANFLPCDRSGNRRFLPVWCDAQKAEVHILENETESRAYIDQLWAEAMMIFRSGKYSLRLPREIEKDLAKYQAPFTQEDTWADLIRSFLEDYSGKIVCCQMLYREALDMYGLPSKIENSQIMEIMSHIPGWRRFQNPRHFEKYKRQKGWERVTTSSDNQGSESNFVDATDIDNPFVTKEI